MTALCHAQRMRSMMGRYQYDRQVGGERLNSRFSEGRFWFSISFLEQASDGPVHSTTDWEVWPMGWRDGVVGFGWTEPESDRREQTIKSRKARRSKSKSTSKSGEWN